MKQRYIGLFFAILFVTGLQAQTFWTESFSNNCSAACAADQYTGTNGAWTQTITGAEGTDPNAWFVSCAENGNGAGSCGSGCASAQNPTLHISAAIGNPFCPNDCGASYDAGGLCGTFTCPATSRRIESPTINCASIVQPIGVDFVYMSAGASPLDQCTFWYYDGSTWTMIQALVATPAICPGGQGLWTSITIPLPASATGNANVKIGFEWINNDDGVGTDPSIAIDDITLSVSSGFASPAFAEPVVGYDALSDQITINTGTTHESVITAEIYSVDGRLVLAQQLNGTVSTISVGEFVGGTYVMRMTGDQRTFAPVKLVIE